MSFPWTDDGEYPDEDRTASPTPSLPAGGLSIRWLIRFSSSWYLMRYLMTEQFVVKEPEVTKFVKNLRHIGICEDCGWWFPVSDWVTEDDARCPKEACSAGVMIVDRAPEPQVIDVKQPADDPFRAFTGEMLGQLLGTRPRPGESDDDFRDRCKSLIQRSCYPPLPDGSYEANVRAAAEFIRPKPSDWKGIIDGTA